MEMPGQAWRTHAGLLRLKTRPPQKTCKGTRHDADISYLQVVIAPEGKKLACASVFAAFKVYFIGYTEPIQTF